MNLTKISGIHAVQAALDYSADKINQVWVDAQRNDKRLSALIDQLKALGIKPEKTEKR